MTAPVTDAAPAPDPAPDPAPARTSKSARTPISAPFKIDVERRYVASCGTCLVSDPDADVGTTKAKELYDGPDRDEAIRLGKEHADDHREYASKLAATPLPEPTRAESAPDA